MDLKPYIRDHHEYINVKNTTKISSLRTNGLSLILLCTTRRGREREGERERGENGKSN